MCARGFRLRGKDSLPYWNSQYEDCAQKLWSPKEIVYPGQRANSLNVSWDSEVPISWCSMKVKMKPSNSDLSTMSSVSCMSTLVESMADAGDPLPDLSQQKLTTCTRKVRLFPKEYIANAFLSWVTASRVNYNKALYHDVNTEEKLSEYDLRAKFVNENIITRQPIVWRVNNGYIAGIDVPLCGGHVLPIKGNKRPNGKILDRDPNPDMSPWMKDVPKTVRHSGISDYVKGKTAAFANLKAGNIKHFKMSFRKTGDRKYPSVNVGNKFNVNGKYLSIFPMKLLQRRPKSNTSKANDMTKSQAAIEDKIPKITDNKKKPQTKKKPIVREQNPQVLIAECDRKFMQKQSEIGFQECRLAYDTGKWFLLVPYEKEIQCDDGEERGIGACDPGSRTFMSVYDGEKAFAVQQRREVHSELQAKMDHFKSLRAHKKISGRSFLRKRRRLRREWDNKMSDLHWKLASEFVSSYKVFGIPTFNTSEMVQGQCLTKGVKREMLGLQHGKFRSKLRHKARARTHVLRVDESFTTKTCHQCGRIREMGGLEIYSCRNSNCQTVVGRDIGSAFSIFLCLMNQRWEK